MPDILKEDAKVIHNRMLENAPGDINLVQGDFFWDATRPAAEEKSELVQVKLQHMLRLAFPQTSYGQFLEFLGEMKGVFKHPPTKATGPITIVGTKGTVIRKGHTVGTIAADDKPSIEFKVLEEVEVDETEKVTVKVECLEPGIKGNVAKHTIKVLSKEINGVKGIDNPEDFRNGTEIEDEEKYRDRVLEAFRNEPLSGAPRDYKRWAKEVPGVGGTYVIPEWNGPGSVKVLVLDANGEPAQEELLRKIRKHIIDEYENGKNTEDGLSPIGALVTIEAPEIIDIDISLKVEFDSNRDKDEVVKDIEKHIKSYLSSIDIKGIVTYKAIEGLLGSMIIRKEGILDYSDLLMNGSTENIDLDYRAPYLNEVSIE